MNPGVTKPGVDSPRERVYGRLLASVTVRDVEKDNGAKKTIALLNKARAGRNDSLSMAHHSFLPE